MHKSKMTCKFCEDQVIVSFFEGATTGFCELCDCKYVFANKYMNDLQFFYFKALHNGNIFIAYFYTIPVNDIIFCLTDEHRKFRMNLNYHPNITPYNLADKIKTYLLFS